MSDGHPKAEGRRNQTEGVKCLSVHSWEQENGRKRNYQSLSAPVEGSGCCLRDEWVFWWMAIRSSAQLCWFGEATVVWLKDWPYKKIIIIAKLIKPTEEMAINGYCS